VLWLAAVAALAGCISAKSIPPGPGSVSSESRQRMERERAQADLERAQVAVETAGAKPDDVRMQRKAAELVARALEQGLPSSGGAATTPQKLLKTAAPVLARLETGPQACVTLPEAGRVYVAAGANSEGAARYARAARECHDVRAALKGAAALRSARRCEEAIALVQSAWPDAREDDRVPLLDEVAACSSPVSLRRNLAFAPPDVVDGYFDLLTQRDRDRRDEEQRRREDEYARRQQEARDQARRDAENARWQCASDCSNARSQCSSGCRGNSSCLSQCNALESACRSGCH
jgi:hypothetical protein